MKRNFLGKVSCFGAGFVSLLGRGVQKIRGFNFLELVSATLRAVLPNFLDGWPENFWAVFPNFQGWFSVSYRAVKGRF